MKLKSETNFAQMKDTLIFVDSLGKVFKLEVQNENGTKVVSEK